MQKTHLGILDEDARSRAFLSVYEDYVVPVSFDTAALRVHVSTTDVDLERSPLWQDDAGETVGLGLLGVRGKRGWIGGFGITKPYRGRRLAVPLAEDVLDRARGLGLEDVLLEVITFNPYAIRTYERTGFETTRELRYMTCAPEVAKNAGDDPGCVEREWRDLLSAHPPAAEPCWQRAPETLAHFEGLVGLAHPGVPEAYAVVRGVPNAVNVLALTAPDRASLGQVVGAVAARYPDAALRLANEPAASPLNPWLDAIGFEEMLRQYEMLVTLGA